MLASLIVPLTSLNVIIIVIILPIFIHSNEDKEVLLAQVASLNIKLQIPQLKPWGIVAAKVIYYERISATHVSCKGTFMWNDSLISICFDLFIDY